MAAVLKGVARLRRDGVSNRIEARQPSSAAVSAPAAVPKRIMLIKTKVSATESLELTPGIWIVKAPVRMVR
jgi:hypothetical protein